MNDLLPSFLEEEADSGDGHGGNIDGFANGHLRGHADASRLSQMSSSAPFFPEVDGLLSLFKDACKELIDLRKQVSVSASDTVLCVFLLVRCVIVICF